MAQQPSADPETDDLVKYFTDVEYLRDLFAKLVVTEKLPKRILAIHGVGGVGKSSLLRMFRLHAKSVHVPVALTSAEESKSAVDVLSNWSNELKAEGITLNNFQKTLVHYKAIQAKVEDQVKKAQEARKKAAEKVGTAVAKAIIGAAISLIPGGPIVNALGGIGVDALVDWLSSFLTKPDIDLLLDPTKTLTKDFLEDIATVVKRKRLVLMLDTFEQMSALNDWVCDVAKQLDSNILLVIAGREMVNWDRRWEGWLAHTQVEELKIMTEDNMRELARRYYATMVGGEPDPKQVEAIIAFARGLPMVLATAVRLWVKYGQEFNIEEHKAEVYGDVVKRLREGVSHELLPILEAAAIVRWFDRSILRAVTKLKDVSAAYEELRQFPFIKSSKDGLRFHDSVRDVMEESLSIDDPQRHKDLHERAAKYFEIQLKKATSNESEKWELERLYHRVSANEKTGIKLFQETAEELTRFRLVSKLKTLINDASTYSVKTTEGNLWLKYYNARLIYLQDYRQEYRLEAESLYQEIINSKNTDSKLRAYALHDWGMIQRERRIMIPAVVDKAIWCFEESLKISPLDNKLALSLLELSPIYRDKGQWERALEYLNRALNYYKEYNAIYDLAIIYLRFGWHYTYRGDWPSAYIAREHCLAKIREANDPPFLKMTTSSWMTWFYTGRWEETEEGLKEAYEISKDLGILSGFETRDTARVAGYCNKFDIAERHFAIDLEKSRALSKYTPREESVALGFYGAVLARKGELLKALDLLKKSLSIKKEIQDTSYMLETINWLGIVHEMLNKWSDAEKYYRENLVDYKWTGRLYYYCGAITGLIRVKHIQGNYESISPLVSEAEQLAQQYEYNDHLASLQLTQGHLAWEQQASEILKYYQHALIYALRYNRFLLDEVLGGRSQGTPLRPIISFCLEHGEEGRKMLSTLRDWWNIGTNDVGAPRSDSISPIPENIPLLEAEKLAREREPGDGSPQKTVIEQIDAALNTGN